MSDEIKTEEPASGGAAEPPRSPEPGTSAVSTPSSSKPRRLSANHVDGVQEAGQPRGLRTGRRRVRFRGLRKSAVAAKYAHALAMLEPIFQEETLRLREAQALVAAAIEHFANTVSSIVDRIEGEDGEPYADNSDTFRKRVEQVRAEAAAEARLARALAELRAAVGVGPPPPPHASDSE